jgi:hypothetical protein
MTRAGQGRKIRPDTSGETMTTAVRTYQITIHAVGGARLLSRDFDFPARDRGDDDAAEVQEAADEKAAAIAIELIGECGSLSPGQRVVVAEVRR